VKRIAVKGKVRNAYEILVGNPKNVVLDVKIILICV